jgi:hypothetical protein
LIAGIDVERKWHLDTTVEASEVAERKKKLKEKGKAAEGWDGAWFLRCFNLFADSAAFWLVFNQDTLYKANKKRLKAMKVDMEAYEKQKKELGERFYDPKESIYGQLSAPAGESIDKLVQHLEEKCAIGGLELDLRTDRACGTDTPSRRSSADAAPWMQIRTSTLSTSETLRSTRRLGVRSTSTPRRSERTWSAVLRCNHCACGGGGGLVVMPLCGIAARRTWRSRKSRKEKTPNWCR